jgi:hypothetical protein
VPGTAAIVKVCRPGYPVAGQRDWRQAGLSSQLRRAVPIVASLVLHAAAVVALSGPIVRPPRPVPVRALAPPVIELAAVAPAADVVPIDVVLLPAPGGLTMRRGGRGVVLAPRAHGEALARIAAAGAGLPVDPSTGELAPAGGGRSRADERVFEARVARDGTVDLKDARNLQVHLSVPRPSRLGRAIGDRLDEWRKDPYGLATKGGAREAANVRRKDEQTDKNDKRTPTTIPIIGGSFDVGDAVERWVGNDPYASRKLSFLDRTRDERVLMGERERARLAADTDQAVRRHLTRLWARGDLTLAEKRAAIFELWDDCADDAAVDDAITGDAGARARRHIVGFIRARLPAGTDRAYRSDELDRLNQQRKSKLRFAPYGER